MFEDFDYTFFPSCYDIEIAITSAKLDKKNISVYGTTDSKYLEMYNANIQPDKFIASRMTTLFPSELSIIDGNVRTYGGLILIRLGQNNVVDNHFKADIELKYTDL